MDTLVKVLLVILGLGFIIFVHELGHFLVAKWHGVRCPVFSLGFGPPLIRFRPKYPWRPGAKNFRYNEVIGPELLEKPKKLRWAMRPQGKGGVGSRLRVLPWSVDKLQPGMVQVVTVEAEDGDPRNASFEPKQLTESDIAELKEQGIEQVHVFDAGETEYRLSLLPLGGYVQMAGGEVHGEQQDHVPDEFLSKKPGPRAQILVAGVAMNIITGFLMFIVAYAIGVQAAPPVVGGAQATVAVPIDEQDVPEGIAAKPQLDVSRPGPAWAAGLKSGDRIVQLQTTPRGEEPEELGPEADRLDLDFTDVRIAVAFTDFDDEVWLTVLREHEDGEVERLRFAAEPVYNPGLGFLVIGVQQVISPEVQAIAPNRAEALKGKLEVGDEIVAVNGTPLRKAFPVPEGKEELPDEAWPRSYPHFQELSRKAMEADPEAPLKLTVRRDGEEVETEVPTFVAPVRVRLGLDHTPLLPVRAVRPGGPADQAVLAERDPETGEHVPGEQRFPLKPGDKVVAVNGAEVHSWEALLRHVQKLTAGEWAKLTVERPTEEEEASTHLLFAKPRLDPSTGQKAFEFVPDMRVLFGSEEETLILRGIDPEGPATDAELVQIVSSLPEGVEIADDLRPGDQVVKVNDRPVQSWSNLSAVEGVTTVQELIAQGWDQESHFAAPVKLEIVRPLAESDAARWEIAEGEALPETVTLVFEVVPSAYGEDLQPRIGFSPRTATVTRQVYGLESIKVGLEKTWVMMQQVFLTIRSLFVGTVDVKNIGGPVMIADASYRFAGWGLGTFIYFMAIISINLAIINILPIPMLDGGHLVFLGAEKIRGKPVPESIQAIFAYLGLALILFLIIFVTINDISRLMGN